ncbi:MAG: ABC transporter ATP-binding protein [Chloroflexi bacterium]|nr:ABC transporter ATP-binding protein [Chloroflexota bacterium]
MNQPQNAIILPGAIPWRQTMAENVIEGRNLVKTYKQFVAVDHIDFSIKPQESFAFLGPNGAGKTTTMRMVCCYSPPTSGTLTVDGKDVRRDCRRIKAILGIVPQENNLDPDLTVGQNLIVYSRYFDIPRPVAIKRATEALQMFQLVERWDSRIDSLSGGMKRRLIFARALLNEPRILVLDEPTTGLDPQARHLVWQKVRYLKEHGATVLFCTQNMEEAAYLADRLVIMHQGKILAEGSPPELIARHAGKEVVELRVRVEQKERVLAQLKSRALNIEEMGDTIYLFGQDGGSLLQGLQLDTEKLMFRQATLEDVFLKLTGRALHE